MKIRTRRSRQQWHELVCQWETTKMTAIAWCREQGISYESFIIWKNRLKSDSSQADCKRPFIELNDGCCPHSGVEIHHRGLKLILCKKFDLEVLLQCLQVLERL